MHVPFSLIPWVCGSTPKQHNARRRSLSQSLSPIVCRMRPALPGVARWPRLRNDTHLYAIPHSDRESESKIPYTETYTYEGSGSPRPTTEDGRSYCGSTIPEGGKVQPRRTPLLDYSPPTRSPFQHTRSPDLRPTKDARARTPDKHGSASTGHLTPRLVNRPPDAESRQSAT